MVDSSIAMLVKIGKRLSSEDLALHTQYFLDARKSLEAAVLENENTSELSSSYKKERDILILSFIPMVVSRAKHYAENYDQVLDLASEGIFGIIRGLEKYDNSRGSKLQTYVFKCITTSILDYLRKKSREDKDSRGGSVDDLKEFLPEKEESVVDQSAYVLNNLRQILSDKEVDLLEQYYGIGREKVDPKKIAEKLNTSYMAVRVRKSKIINKLRQHAFSVKKLVA